MTPAQIGLALRDLKWRLDWQYLLRHKHRNPCPRFYVRKDNSQWDGRAKTRVVGLLCSQLDRLVRSYTAYSRLLLPAADVNLPLVCLRSLQQLRSHPHVVCVPADKNLGLAVLDRSRYIALCLEHLSDPRNFEELSISRTHALLVSARRELDIIRQSTAHCSFLGSRAREYSTFFGSSASNVLPRFYGLLKVHKHKMAIRPIVASHSFVTTAVSKVCAFELHKLVRAHLPRVLEDSKSLIRVLETTRILRPIDGVFFATADVEGLYVNIPTDAALHAIARFTRRHAPSGLASLLVRWSTFVFDYALVGFEGRTFRQLWGFPMGTALAPDAANIYMSIHEDFDGVWDHPRLDSVLPPAAALPVGLRLIDDFTFVFTNVTRSDVDDFMEEVSRRIAPALRITYQVASTTMDTLDLHVFKGPRFEETRLLAFRTHQKPMHKYQYLPWLSRQPRSVYFSSVKSEILRHATNCSTRSWFEHMVQLYVLRQRVRGFPAFYLHRWVHSVDWHERRRILDRPTRVCANDNNRDVPIYLKLQYDLVTAAVPSSIMYRFGTWIDALADPLPNRERSLLCWTKGLPLGSFLCATSGRQAELGRGNT